MPIEIRELVIKVKVEEATKKASDNLDMNEIRKSITSICKKEIKKQLEKNKER